MRDGGVPAVTIVIAIRSFDSSCTTDAVIPSGIGPRSLLAVRSARQVPEKLECIDIGCRGGPLAICRLRPTGMRESTLQWSLVASSRVTEVAPNRSLGWLSPSLWTRCKRNPMSCRRPASASRSLPSGSWPPFFLAVLLALITRVRAGHVNVGRTVWENYARLGLPVLVMLAAALALCRFAVPRREGSPMDIAR